VFISLQDGVPHSVQFTIIAKSHRLLGELASIDSDISSASISIKFCFDAYVVLFLIVKIGSEVVTHVLVI
jgi:hypothetical protein